MRARAAAAAAAMSLVLVGCGAFSSLGGDETSGSVAVPLPPAPVRPVSRPSTPAPPGTVVTTDEIMAPSDARAWRVDYHSTSARGDDIAARALLVVPMTEPPSEGFPLVVWGHPTKGLADDCAPSLEGATTIPLVEELLKAGFAVVAPDYEGLGAEGPNPYLVGPSEGHTMLDAARAAMTVKGSGISPSSPVALWGFSQGGHAAAFAGELAATYAPELELFAVALAAPVSDVAHFARRSEGWPAQMGVLVSIAYGFSAAYPELDLAPVLTQRARDDLPELERLCISEVNQLYDRPVEETMVASPRDLPGWAGRLEESRAGQRPIPVPVLVIQGDKDDIIDPSDTTTLVANYCRLGMPVAYAVRPGENHGVLTTDTLLPWLLGRLVGERAPSDCLGDVIGTTTSSQPGLDTSHATRPGPAPARTKP